MRLAATATPRATHTHRAKGALMCAEQPTGALLSVHTSPRPEKLHSPQPRATNSAMSAAACCAARLEKSWVASSDTCGCCSTMQMRVSSPPTLTLTFTRTFVIGACTDYYHLRPVQLLLPTCYHLLPAATWPLLDRSWCRACLLRRRPSPPVVSSKS